MYRFLKSSIHDSQRGYFAYALFKEMEKNKDVFLVVGDLGYKIFDRHFACFPERTFNTGAAEQSLIGISVGLALEGKIPFAYSITPFLLYRGFETIRNYINREKIAVKLVGGGRGRDYLADGWSHWAEEDKKVMRIFKNIKSYWPETKEEVPNLVKEMIKKKKPYYLNLKR